MQIDSSLTRPEFLSSEIAGSRIEDGGIAADVT
jgi:hypothetical protein